MIIFTDKKTNEPIDYEHKRFIAICRGSIVGLTVRLVAFLEKEENQMRLTGRKGIWSGGIF